ncbi:HTH-type transcriptional repressor CytR [Calidithermus terrae]|uniref:HTH-type transcriptional repressor CytR n=1 Tax=Calidithermus terrae TaxID=1408545 RepID=A0A399F147_9DEIN|nr:LacI family DNA-binding transcriptional regulator [Calidithermus terrae]RIH90507.1 HTH-type transcriptional repressor CytR [Calidithermus terrae]
MPTRKPRVTSQQVAKHAGVSRTTVSFVLNNVPGVVISPETRLRVLRAAKELGYVPNAAARTLVSGQTGTIALVIPHAEHLKVDAFLPQLLYSLNEVSYRHGYRVLLEPVEDAAKPGAYLELVYGKRIDGLIVVNARTQDDPHLLELAQMGFPLVLMGARLATHEGIYSVDTDNRTAARHAVDHLLRLGYRRIAHIAYAPPEYHAANLRLQGYTEALEAAGLEADPALVAYGNYSAESGYEAMLTLLERKPYPRALFAGNDTIALGAMAALHEKGLRIPDDVAVVGYDDIPTAAYAFPPLTTVRTQAVLHGSVAAEMLMKLMHGKTPQERHVILETPLVIRQSCGAKAAKAEEA